MITRRRACLGALAIAAVFVGCRGGVVGETTGAGVRPAAGVLEYHNDRRSQLYALPRVPEPRARLDGAAFVRVPPMRGGARIAAYGGSPNNRDAVLWLLVAAERDAGRSVILHKIRIGEHAEPSDGQPVVGSAIPAAEACRTTGWIAAFFIEGVAPPVAGPVVLRYESDSLLYRIELDPQRHTVRGGPWVTVRPADVGRKVINENLAVLLPRPVAPGLIAALWRDDDGWLGSAQVRTYGRFDWSFRPNVHGPPASVNEVRLYAWQLPVACEAWGKPRDA